MERRLSLRDASLVALSQPPCALAAAAVGIVILTNVLPDAVATIAGSALGFAAWTLAVRWRVRITRGRKHELIVRNLYRTVRVDRRDVTTIDRYTFWWGTGLACPALVLDSGRTVPVVAAFGLHRSDVDRALARDTPRPTLSQLAGAIATVLHRRLGRATRGT